MPIVHISNKSNKASSDKYLRLISFNWSTWHIRTAAGVVYIVRCRAKKNGILSFINTHIKTTYRETSLLSTPYKKQTYVLASSNNVHRRNTRMYHFIHIDTKLWCLRIFRDLSVCHVSISACLQWRSTSHSVRPHRNHVTQAAHACATGSWIYGTLILHDMDVCTILHACLYHRIS